MNRTRTRSPLAAAGAMALACSLGAALPAHAAPRGPAAAVTETAFAGPADGTVACTARDGLAGRLAHDVAGALRDRRSRVSLAWAEHRTGATCVLGPQRTFDAASVVKPVVLGTLLWSRHGVLSPQEKTLARKMIVDSDNAATERLWKDLSTAAASGPSVPTAVQGFLTAAHMDHTVPSRGTTFGLTRVTAPDLLRLLQVYRGGAGLLDAPSRAYALGLMADVRADQRWGAPAGAPEGAEVHVKNGWLQRSRQADDVDDRGDWKINSMAAVTSADRDYDLVVLTENNRVPGHPAREGYAYGVATVEGVAKAVNRALAADGPDHAGASAAGAGKPPAGGPAGMDVAVAAGGAVVAAAGHRHLRRGR
ncbi:serine hydrolase [Streptomyces sp. NPDC089919]|uniref:serine hydrolase n=1 Tax=Streptomyces sp. NPDC089919 TaxID=3155188 RepID=UPI0034343C2A